MHMHKPIARKTRDQASEAQSGTDETTGREANSRTPTPTMETNAGQRITDNINGTGEMSIKFKTLFKLFVVCFSLNLEIEN